MLNLAPPLTDLGDVLQRPLHHPDDGDLLHLHWAHLQRLLLQVPQHLRLWLERQGHVHQSAVDVSYPLITLYVPSGFVLSELIQIFSLMLQKQNPPNQRSAHVRPQRQRGLQWAVPIRHRPSELQAR